VTLLTNPNIPNLCSDSWTSSLSQNKADKSHEHEQGVPKNRRSFKRVLIVAPVNTLENWAEEFHKWLKNVKRERSMIKLHIIRSKDNPEKRKSIIKDWHGLFGVLIIGYPLLQKLSRYTLRLNVTQGTDMVL
jgi:SNF2 family DNA or RNA helicase